MNSSSEASKLLVELLLKTACDPLPRRSLRGVYLFGQTRQNQESVLDVGLDLFSSGRAETVLIPETHARSGYPGFDVWKAELINRGVPNDRIIGVPIDSELLLHTNNEAIAVVRHCQSIGYGALAITAPPFHQLRAFMSMVSAAKDLDYAMQIYSKIGNALPWYEQVSHSQGILHGTRESFIYTELERIDRYYQKGDLSSVSTILQYLRERDAVASEASV